MTTTKPSKTTKSRLRPGVSWMLGTAILLSSQCFLGLVDGYPFFFLSEHEPMKCFVLHSPKNVNLEIEYQVFGGKSDEPKPPPINRHDRHERKRPVQVKPVEVKAETHNKNVYLEITTLHVTDQRMQEDNPREPVRRPIRKPLPFNTGVIEYQPEYEGTIRICAHQRARHPSDADVGISLKFNEVAISASADMPPDADQADTVEENKKHRRAKEHLSELETLLNGMINDSSLLMNTAESVKNEESEFHQRSVDINAAARWWPIFHIVVLLITGFTQANHVVSFFKSRHII